MKLQSLIATALAVMAGSAILAQNPLATKPAATKNAVRDDDLHEKLNVYVARLKHGDVKERREAVDALGHIAERAKGADAVLLLEKALKAEQYLDRIVAAEWLWRIKQDPAAVAAMIADLKDKEQTVRHYAAEALGRFGVGAKAAVPALVEALNDSWYVSHAAAVSLWQIDKHPKAIPTLVADLGDRTTERASAAGALGQIGPDAKSAVPALLEALKDKPWSVGPEFHIPVAQALWQIEKHPAAVLALIECLKDNRRDKATGVLRMIGIDAKAAVPALTELLKDEKSGWNAASALATMGPEAQAKAVAALIERTKPQTTKQIKPPPGGGNAYLGLASVVPAFHGEPYIDKVDAGSPAAKAGLKRFDTLIGVNDTNIKDIQEFRTAMKKLALKPDDQVTFVIDRGESQVRITVTARAWPGLEEGVPVPNSGETRIGAATLLWEINKHPAAALALGEVLKKPETLKEPYPLAAPEDKEEAIRLWNAEVEARAAQCLYSMGVDAKPAMPALKGALKSKNKLTRYYAAKALCRLGAEAEGIPVLVEALKDKESHFRHFAAFSLWRINKDPAALTMLLESLKDKETRASAAITLWDINRHPAAVPALLEDLKSGGGWNFTLVHIGMEKRAAVAALTDALKDEDEGVRTSAAQWLKKIDPEAAKKAGVK